MTTGDEPAFDGWERHRREQVLATLRTSPTQRLRWLEAAIRFAALVGALPRSGQGLTPEEAHRPPSSAGDRSARSP